MAKKPNIKVLRIKSNIQKRLTEIFRNWHNDNEYLKLTTITEIQLTNDLSICKIYVTDHRFRNEHHIILDYLNKNCKAIRQQLAKFLVLRKTPQLIFIYDDLLDKSLHLEKLINKS